MDPYCRLYPHVANGCCMPTNIPTCCRNVPCQYGPQMCNLPVIILTLPPSTPQYFDGPPFLTSSFIPRSTLTGDATPVQTATSLQVPALQFSDKVAQFPEHVSLQSPFTRPVAQSSAFDSRFGAPLAQSSGIVSRPPLPPPEYSRFGAPVAQSSEIVNKPTISTFPQQSKVPPGPIQVVSATPRSRTPARPPQSKDFVSLEQQSLSGHPSRTQQSIAQQQKISQQPSLAQQSLTQRSIAQQQQQLAEQQQQLAAQQQQLAAQQQEVALQQQNKPPGNLTKLGVIAKELVDDPVLMESYPFPEYKSGSSQFDSAWDENKKRDANYVGFLQRDLKHKNEQLKQDWKTGGQLTADIKSKLQNDLWRVDKEEQQRLLALVQAFFQKRQQILAQGVGLVQAHNKVDFATNLLQHQQNIVQQQQELAAQQIQHAAQQLSMAEKQSKIIQQSIAQQQSSAREHSMFEQQQEQQQTTPQEQKLAFEPEHFVGQQVAEQQSQHQSMIQDGTDPVELLKTVLRQEKELAENRELFSTMHQQKTPTAAEQEFSAQNDSWNRLILSAQARGTAAEPMLLESFPFPLYETQHGFSDVDWNQSELEDAKQVNSRYNVLKKTSRQLKDNWDRAKSIGTKIIEKYENDLWRQEEEERRGLQELVNAFFQKRREIVQKGAQLVLEKRKTSDAIENFKNRHSLNH